MIEEIEEHDVIELIRERPDLGLGAKEIGVVVNIAPDAEGNPGYLIEFNRRKEGEILVEHIRREEMKLYWKCPKKDYITQVEALLEQKGYKNQSPATLINNWILVVDDIESGYSFCLSEYDDDLGVRETVEIILSSDLLEEFAEREEFRQVVEPVDNRFRSLLRPDVQRPVFSPYWWIRGIPFNTGDEFNQDMKDFYGIIL